MCVRPLKLVILAPSGNFRCLGQPKMDIVMFYQKADPLEKFANQNWGARSPHPPSARYWSQLCLVYIFLNLQNCHRQLSHTSILERKNLNLLLIFISSVQANCVLIIYTPIYFTIGGENIVQNWEKFSTQTRTKTSKRLFGEKISTINQQKWTKWTRIDKTGY